MRILQFHVPGAGKRLGILSERTIIDITSEDYPDALALFTAAASNRTTLDELLDDCPRGQEYAWNELDAAPSPDTPHILLPIDAPEVWGCGVTYYRSASLRDQDSEQDIYTRVYNSERPEVFFKATPERCAPHRGMVGIRSDSELTAAEPELAFILGAPGQVLGFTICNDVSAWDLERENPLYLPQSKTFEGCCALGPCIATPSTIPDPYNLSISCRIVRDRAVIFDGHTNSSQIKFQFETLAGFLCRNNPVPVGTVVSTGTGIMVPNEYALAPGDTVEIEIERIGRLVTGVRKLSG